MANSIQSWLDETQSVDQLVRWLRGYDLPWAWDGDEPYRCLMRGLDRLELARKTSSEFCKRVAAVLDHAPELAKAGPRPEQVLYNVLMLAHCLHCPTCLGPSLYNLFDGSKITGRWMGVDLQVALREALFENQIDQKFRGVWECMLEERFDTCPLPGDALDGFRGIFKMPSPIDATQPDVDAIVWGFSRMIGTLNRQRPRLELPIRVERFNGLYQALTRHYPHVDWALRISEAARKNDSKRWRWAKELAKGYLKELPASAERNNELDALYKSMDVPVRTPDDLVCVP